MSVRSLDHGLCFVNMFNHRSHAQGNETSLVQWLGAVFILFLNPFKPFKDV